MTDEERSESAPPPDAEANVSQITDEQWLAGHRALMESGDIPPEELAYLYAPDVDPSTVTVDDLTPFPDDKEPEEVSTDG